MARYLVVGLSSGILFGLLDAFINANGLARRLYRVYEPIAKQSINAPIGVAIDLIYGLILAGIYLLLRDSLPGATGLLKGLSYGLGVWFLRVVMQTVSQWMMLQVPGATLLYTTVSGLAEMLLLGVFCGLTLTGSP